jgi:uncharacterized Zn finger protein
MNWYRGWNGYPAYVPVAARRARAARALAGLARKRGRPAEPVVLARRAIAATYWGKAWCDNLERYMDFVNRLPRGRSYLRNGSVVDLAITPGSVHALVAGTRLYTVTVGIAPLARPRWRSIVARCTGRIGSLVALLRGELSSDVLAVLVDAKAGLFPAPRDISMQCSCPDWARMCKHVAAVLYGVGARLDTKPELFFTLRQVDQAELVTHAAAGAGGRRGGRGGKRVAADRLADVFGIDIDDSPVDAMARRARKASRAPTPGPALSARSLRRPSPATTGRKA